MSWFYLIVAGILEWGWPIGLKFGWTEKGFSFWPLAGAVVSMLGSGYFLLVAQRDIPIGTAYAVWTGIGAVGTFLLGVWLLDEPAKAMRFVSVGLVVMGIVGLKMFS